MKVDSSPDSYIGSVASGPQRAAATPPAAPAGATSAAPAPGAPASGVQVTLSSTTQALSGPGNGNDVFNADKVEAMKQAIANGTFQVNAEAIADKMLANAAEMLNASRQ